MMVSANSAICTPAEPTVAGPSALKKRLTSSSQRGQRNAVMTPLRKRVAADQQHLENAGDQHAPGGGVAGVGKNDRERRASPSSTD